MNTAKYYRFVGMGILLWLLCKAPTPEFFLIGADGGHQLTGAVQVLTVGEHPYLDFFETYGPLTFYSSALGQLITGIRPIGEVGLQLFGFLIGYLLMFWLLWRISESLFSALIILVLALVLQPQYYKYYCVLVPLLALCTAYLYIYRRNIFSFCLLAASVAIAGLFRHDFGVFTLLMAFVVIGSNQAISLGRRLQEGVVFLGIVVVFCLPWILFLAKHQAFGQYIEMITYASTAMSKGLSLPHPLLQWVDFPLSLGFLVVVFLPFALLIVLFLCKGKLHQNEFRLQLAISSLAIVSLVQSSHRADFYHLLEGIPPTFICLAFLVRQMAKMFTATTGISTSFLVSIVLVPLVMASPYGIIPSGSSLQILRKVSYFKESRRVYIDRLVKENGKFWPAKAVQQIRDRTEEGERIAIYPFFMKFNYFAMRPFAAGLMLLAPGYFDSDYFLNKAMSKLEEQKVRYVFWNKYFSFDGQQERNPVNSASLLYEFVEDKYYKAGELYGFTVYAMR